MFDLEDYLDRLASADPTPGGGSAATIVGALAAALVAMVARVTRKSDKLAPVHAEADAITAEADALRARFLAARPIDEAAYGAVVAAQALPRGTDAERAERTARLQAALVGAADAPLAVATLAADTLALAERAALLRNVHLMSDVTCAVRFARAALDASAANVQVNHRFLKNAELIAAQTARLTAVFDAARESESRALTIIISP